MNSLKILKNVKLILIIHLVILYGCQENQDLELETSTIAEKEAVKLQYRQGNTGNATFDTYNHDLNSDALAETEFNNEIDGWNTTLTSVEMYTATKGRLNFELPENYGNGMKATIDIANSTGYQLYFDVKFQSGFDFSRGGKVGFGFVIGRGVNGGNSTQATVDNYGGSYRVCWYANGGTPYLYPYIYHKNMPGTYGNELQYSNQYNITANANYRVRVTIKSNTSANATDGYGKMEVSTNYGSSYTTVWEDSNMRWSGSSAAWERRINKLYFSTFRGGGNTTWNGSLGTQSIYFDNVKWYLYN